MMLFTKPRLSPIICTELLYIVEPNESIFAARGAIRLRGRRDERAADPMNLIWLIPAEGSGISVPTERQFSTRRSPPYQGCGFFHALVARKSNMDTGTPKL